MFIYKKIGLGGTFDHFHKGHQVFLMFASQLAEHLVIGITTPEMITHKKHYSQIEPYETRAEAVKQFTKNFINKVDVVPLTDPYGPTLMGSTVEAIAATSATKSGAEAVNKKRSELGLSQLPIHTCDLENDENGEPLSSEKIRLGKVNRQGKVYANLLEATVSLFPKQKEAFSTAHGEIVQHPSYAELTLVVGDTSLVAFRDNNWPYDLGVFDLMKQRKPYQPPVLSNTAGIPHATNGSGEITAEMSSILSQALQNKSKHVLIHGEEDLAAVVLVLLSPLGTHIYYGQRKQGLVEMVVTEEKKEFVRKTFSNP